MTQRYYCYFERRKTPPEDELFGEQIRIYDDDARRNGRVSALLRQRVRGSSLTRSRVRPLCFSLFPLFFAFARNYSHRYATCTHEHREVAEANRSHGTHASASSGILATAIRGSDVGFRWVNCANSYMTCGRSRWPVVRGRLRTNTSAIWSWLGEKVEEPIGLLMLFRCLGILSSAPSSLSPNTALVSRAICMK